MNSCTTVGVHKMPDSEVTLKGEGGWGGGGSGYTGVYARGVLL